MKKLFLISSLIIGLLFSIHGCSSVSAEYYGAKYCSAEPNPKTWIGERVEVPISIYWEDGLYNGFNDEDAKLMVKNYLDGVHLQTMALNTTDGKVKIYSYKDIPQSYLDLVEEGFAVAKETKKQKVLFDEARNHKNSKDYPENFKKISKSYFKINNQKSSIQKQIEKEKEKLNLVITQTTKDSMSKMNYTVTTKIVPLPDSARKYIYIDEVKVTDNKVNKTLAYNRRVMQLYSSSLLPDMVGGRRFVSEPICGGKTPKIFDHDIFISIGHLTNARAKHNIKSRNK